MAPQAKGWIPAYKLSDLGGGNVHDARRFLKDRKEARLALFTSGPSEELLAEYKAFLGSGTANFGGSAVAFAGWDAAKRLVSLADCGTVYTARAFIKSKKLTKAEKKTLLEGDRRSMFIKRLVEEFGNLYPPDLATMPDPKTWVASDEEWTMPPVVPVSSNGNAVLHTSRGLLELLHSLSDLAKAHGIDSVADAAQVLRDTVRSCT